MRDQGPTQFTIVVRAAFMRKVQHEVVLGRKRRIHAGPEAKPDHEAVNPAFPGTLRQLARSTAAETHVVLRECILLSKARSTEE